MMEPLVGFLVLSLHGSRNASIGCSSSTQTYRFILLFVLLFPKIFFCDGVSVVSSGNVEEEDECHLCLVPFDPDDDVVADCPRCAHHRSHYDCDRPVPVIHEDFYNTGLSEDGEDSGSDGGGGGSSSDGNDSSGEEALTTTTLEGEENSPRTATALQDTSEENSVRKAKSENDF